MEEIYNKLTRKDREKLQRKNEILFAAAKLFSQKGYNKTTLEEIASEAEFGTGTIYNYFQSKEDIYKNILETIFDSSFEILFEVNQQTKNIKDFFKHYTKRIFDFFYQNQNALMLFLSYMTSIEEKPIKLRCESIEEKQTKINQILKAKINSGITNHEIRPVNPEHLLRYYFSLVFPYITNLIKSIKINQNGSDNVNLNEHVDFVLDILFNGITYEKKNKELK